MADDRILLGHGSGGSLMHGLIAGEFAPSFGIGGFEDSAVMDMPEGARLAVTTDSYVVKPIFFPGGDIGELAVYGTVNDLAVAGARPLYLTAGFIIEEGFLFADLRRVVASMARAAEKAGVSIVAGDTKVVERGKCDGIYINTSGTGVVPAGVELGTSMIKEGDAILLSGSIGNHGVSVMAERNGLFFDPQVLSDTAPLNGLAGIILAAGKDVRMMRDPTRGGLATTLKEFALGSGLCMSVSEDLIPVEPGVRGACDILGLDPLYVANEGVLLAVVSPAVAEYLLSRMKAHPLGGRSAMIGRVIGSPGGAALLETGIGGRRIIDMLQGDQLPRIC